MSRRPDIALYPARVLIVDDERHNRQLLEVMLSPEGYVLETAATGEEALAMVAAQRPDLILLDIMMPGMDGYAVAAKLKANIATRNIPVIVVTALDDRKARMLGLGSGAEDFLTKPVDRAELTVRVRNLLRLKAFGDYYDKYSQMLEGEVVSRTADLVEKMKQAMVLAEQAALLDLAQDAIIVRDMNGRIVFWNRGAEALYGWRREEALGLKARELLKTEFSEPTEAIAEELRRNGCWEGEAVHYTRAGTGVIVATRWALQSDSTGTPVRILTINNDITGRKRAEVERLLLTERLSMATEVARVGVWEWDLATNTLTWDTTMFAIYGWAPVVPMSHDTWLAAVHPDDLLAVQAGLRTAIDAKGQSSAEYRINRPDGSTRIVSAVGRVVLDARGNVSRVIGVDMDVTERKAAEGALEQSRQDQLRFKDDFLSHVSHELRSPLTAIKQFTTILLGGLAGELNPQQREYQLIVLKNIRQLQLMIDDLLEVTRLESGKLSVEAAQVSVADAVTDTFNTLQESARAKGITLLSDLPSNLPLAHADQTRLRQILIILLDNAIKFTPNGGMAHVRARLFEEDPRFLLLDVSDTGCGISPDVADRLFERLYQASGQIQASRKGLGLGLYICKELVTRQGGRIWAGRRAPQGSIFSFTLPVSQSAGVDAPLVENGSLDETDAAQVVSEAR